MTTAPKWPHGKRLAVVVSVDFLDTHAILAKETRMQGREKSLSVWQYGARRGVDRLLQVFDEFKFAASWFVPGRVAIDHRALVQRIHLAGHEVGNATYACEDFDCLSLARQRDSLLGAQGALIDTIGEMPVGFRAPFGNWSPGFTQHLREVGIEWSSSWRGDDRPYLHPPSGTSSAPLVEVPLHYELEDEPYFAFNLFPPVPIGQPRIASYREVLANWRQDFAGFRRFGLCLPLRLHPEILGTAGRVDLLRELLSTMRSHDDVWIATGRDVARWWRSQHGGNETGHPVDVLAPFQQAPELP
jgi:peptidoglycan/xylan/chitin deacetylase (PgdA/CDA1 family)